MCVGAVEAPLYPEAGAGVGRRGLETGGHLELDLGEGREKWQNGANTHIRVLERSAPSPRWVDLTARRPGARLDDEVGAGAEDRGQGRATADGEEADDLNELALLGHHGLIKS